MQCVVVSYAFFLGGGTECFVFFDEIFAFRFFSMFMNFFFFPSYNRMVGMYCFGVALVEIAKTKTNMICHGDVVDWGQQQYLFFWEYPQYVYILF
jgi:hypothetical protein